MSVLHSIVSVWRSEGIGGVLKRANLRVQSNLPSGNVSGNFFALSAQRHYNAGRVASAERLAKKSVSIDPGNLRGLHLLLKISDSNNDVFLGGRYRCAIACVDRQNYAHYLAPGASMLSSSWQQGDALRHIRSALVVYPNDLDLWNATAVLCADSDSENFEVLASELEFRELDISLGLREKIANRFIQMNMPEKAHFWLNDNAVEMRDQDHKQLDLALKYYKSDKLPNAKKIYSKLTTSRNLGKRKHEPHLFLGRISYRSGEYLRATEHFGKVLNLAPEFQGAYKPLLTCYWKLGFFDDVRKVIAIGNKYCPSLPELERFQTRINEKASKTKLSFLPVKKIATSVRSVSKTDEFREWMSEGKLLEQKGISVNSHNYWQKAASKFPTKAEPQLKLLRSKVKLRYSIETIEHSHATLARLKGDLKRGSLWLAQAHANVGNSDQAKKLFTEGTLNHPEVGGYWEGLLKMTVAADDTAGATALIKKSEKQFQPKTASEAETLIRIYRIGEQFDVADTLAEKMIKKFPDFRRIRQQHVKYLMDHGRYGQAWSHIKNLRAIDPRDVGVAIQYSKCLAAFQMVKPPININNVSSSSAKMPESGFQWLTEHAPSPEPIDPKGRVIIVSSSLRPGGAERQVHFTLLGLQNIDHQFSSVDLILNTADPNIDADFYLPKLIEKDIRVDILMSPDAIQLKRDLLGEEPHAAEMIRFFEAMPYDVRRFSLPLYVKFMHEKPTIVHLWQDRLSVYGAMAAIAAGVPKIVISIRSTRPDARRRSRRFLKPAFQHFIKNYPGRVTLLNNSSAGARDYESWLNLKKGSVSVIYNGLDIDEFRRSGTVKDGAKIRKQLGIPKTSFVVGSIGRFTFEKRPELWLKIAGELLKLCPDTHFLLLGDGPLLDKCKKIISDRGLDERFHFVGNKPQVGPWYKAMDLKMLTSEREGLPNVLIEAQCLGIPVVSTNVGGASETMVPGKTGILFTSEDPVLMAGQVQQFFNDKIKFKAASTAAAGWVKGAFSINSMAQQTKEFYLERGHNQRR